MCILQTPPEFVVYEALVDLAAAAVTSWTMVSFFTFTVTIAGMTHPCNPQGSQRLIEIVGFQLSMQAIVPRERIAARAKDSPKYCMHLSDAQPTGRECSSHRLHH
jgi:hypothetical protein